MPTSRRESISETSHKSHTLNMHQSALLSEVAAGRELARLSSKQSQSENAVETAADPEAKDLGQEAGSPVSPLNIVEEQRPKERWNDPAINVWRVVCSFYGMMLIGFHDGIIGVRRPLRRSCGRMLTHCRLSYHMYVRHCLDFRG